MAMSVASATAGRRRHQRRGVMSEINVTPMVDVMLVLLIIFMISAPLLTVGVPIDLPQTQAKSLDQDKEPLAISVNVKGQVYLQETEIGVDELVPKLKAITEARGGADERIYVRGDRQVDYGAVMKVMGRLSGAANETKPATDGPPSPEVKPPAPAQKAPPEPKRDLIAEAIKKDVAKKPEPKKAEAKAPAPPKPQTEQPKFDPRKVEALLDKRVSQRLAAAGDALHNDVALGAANGMAAQLSMSELDAFRKRLEECWSPPAGIDSTAKLHVVIRVLFNTDGSVAKPPDVVSGSA